MWHYYSWIEVDTIPWDQQGFHTLIVQEQVTFISESAFAKCANLRTMRWNVKSYGYEHTTDQPKYPNLETVIFGDAVDTIPGFLCYRCEKLKNVVLGNNVKRIGSYAFSEYNAIEEINLPRSLSSLGEKVFLDCTSLTSINIDEENPHFCSYEGVLFNKDTTTLIQYPCGKQGAYIIPQSVKSIGESAFAHCPNITSVVIPSSVDSIKFLAFDYCNSLVSITCEATTPPIWDFLFTSFDPAVIIYVPKESVNAYKAAEGWKNFTNILPIKTIIASGNCGAQGDNLKWELTSDSVLTISGTGAMANYETLSQAPWWYYRYVIKRAIVNEGVTVLGDWAFSDCKFTTISLPNTITNIPFGAFSNCTNLTSIAIPENVASVGAYAFCGCDSLRSITIPKGVTDIDGQCTFSCANLIEINVAAENPNYRSIDGALYTKDSTYLIQYPYGKRGTCVLSDHLERIGYLALSSELITSITCSAKVPPTLDKGAIDAVDKSIPLYVPGASVEVYKATAGWSAFTNILPIPGTEPCGADTRMPAPEYTFKHVAAKCTSKLQFTNTSHVVTRYGGEEVHTKEPCTNVLWRFRRLSDNKATETSEQNPVYQCWSKGDTIEVILTSFLGEGNMCDSSRIDTIVVPKITPDNTEYHYNICSNDLPVLFDDKEFWKDTTYTAHYTTSAGCDSTSTLFLTVHPSSYHNYAHTAYVGDEITWQNQYIKAEKTGTYYYFDTLKTYFGCDSILVLNLEVKPKSEKMCSWLVESNDLEMGVVTTSLTEPSYKYGTQITVEASPNSGYKFVKWSDGKKYNPYKFSLLDDKYLLAIFGAEDEEPDTTTVQPSSTTATFTWPLIVGGNIYNLIIYLDIYVSSNN